MKRDIVAYDETVKEGLGRILFKLDVPSFGPGTGIELLRIVEGLDKVVKENQNKLTPDMVMLLQCFRDRITDVCGVMAYQQGLTIDHMERLMTSAEKVGFVRAVK